MKKLCISHILLAGMLTIVASTTFALDITQKQLLGRWEFVYWSESDNASSKRLINMIMDFKKDGTIVNDHKKGRTTASYSINGNVIEYKDKRGTQQWRVISFSPDEYMKVDHMGAVMYFERR